MKQKHAGSEASRQSSSTNRSLGTIPSPETSPASLGTCSDAPGAVGGGRGGAWGGPRRAREPLRSRSPEFPLTQPPRCHHSLKQSLPA